MIKYKKKKCAFMHIRVTVHTINRRVATREKKMKKILSLILAMASIVASLVVFTACGEPKDGGPEIAVYLGESV